MGAITRALANNITTGGVITSSGINNNSLSSVTSLPSSVGGKVLQAVRTTTTGEYTNATATYTTFSALQTSITTINANSKFLVILNPVRFFTIGTGDPAAHGDCLWYFSDGTNNSPTFRMNKYTTGSGQALMPAFSAIIQGTHSAGASLDIDFYGKISDGSITVGDTGGTSTMTVMEIA